MTYRLHGLNKPVNKLRIALWQSDPFCPVSCEVQERVERVGRDLAKAGAQVSDKARPDFRAEDSQRVFYSLLMAALGSRMPERAFTSLVKKADALNPADQSAVAQVLRDQTMRVNPWTTLNEQRGKIRWAWHQFFKDYDFMITPIMPTSAFPQDQSNFGSRTIVVDGKSLPYFNQIFWAGLVGAPLLPATVIPTGVDRGGLPIGLQIIGPLFGDLKTIQLAQVLEGMGYAFEAPKGYD